MGLTIFIQLSLVFFIYFIFAECPPFNATYGNSTVEQSGFAYLDEIKFVCYANYYVFGTLYPEYRLSCMENGTWNEEPPNCVQIGEFNPLLHLFYMHL